MRLSQELCKFARSRLVEGRVLSQVELRRATSDCYYAMYHCVCEALVEPLGGIDPKADAGRKEYMEKLYRSPGHIRIVRNASKHGALFSDGLAKFSDHLISMKGKRENADYNPSSEFSSEGVKSDLFLTSLSVEGFWEADKSERTAFAYALTREVKDRKT